MCSLVLTADWEQGLQNLQGRGGTWQDEALLALARSLKDLRPGGGWLQAHLPGEVLSASWFSL